jgi:hypothetical protein
MAGKVTRTKGLRPEYVVALIGMLGGVAGAVITNWDRLSSKVVSAEYSGYQPTGNFETEMRYFLEVSGARAQAENSNKEMLAAMKSQFIQNNDIPQEDVDKFISVLSKSMYDFDESVRDMLPIWQKYFTIEQIQELNKFYSTPNMQNLVRVQPAITRESMQILVQKSFAKSEKMIAELEKEMAEDTE